MATEKRSIAVVWKNVRKMRERQSEIMDWIIYYIYIYYWFIVRFPIGLDFLFITFTIFLHLLLSWTSSLSISSSPISTSTLSKPRLSWSSNRSSAFNSILHTFLHPVLITFSHHMSIPSQSTTSNESCDRLNSNQPSQFFICSSVFQ